MARKQKKAKIQTSPFFIALLLAKFLLLWVGRLPLIIFYIRGRGRGRPRKLPFLKFYFKKIDRNLLSKLPKKTKIATILSISLLCIYLYTNLIVNFAYQLPTPKSLESQPSPLTSEVYDRNGKLLYRFYEGRNRSLINLEHLPKHVIYATIAAEDKNFYKHFGFDPLAIARAAYHNITQGSQEGASTITQQLIKNSLLTAEKTYTRKIKELILAFWAERIYSKDEILQMYFNQTPYGGTAWGIEAASQTFFGKPASDLNLAEAAFLAGLPASPSEFAPFGPNPGLGKQRQKWVLDRMVDLGFIGKDESSQALSATLDLKPQSNNILAPHFVFYVRKFLSEQLGARVVSQGGLKITTTLDYDIQKEAEKIVKEEIENLASLSVGNGAAMITDAKTGQILSMVGSRDYHYPNFGNFNATLAFRQPGSSIKVITYATAFQQGFTPANTILDTSVTFKDNWGSSYTPKNYDNTFHGPVSIRTALGSSYNIPAVKMLATAGLDKMIQTAKDLGITTFNDPQRYGLSLTLGGGEVKLIDMMAVYGSFSQGGLLKRPTPILQVADSQGNILDQYDERKVSAIKEEVAYLITNILSDNQARTPAFGPNSLLNIGGQVAVKTGTSDNKRDNWTFGYTPEFVVGVWVGNNDNSQMHPSLTSGVTGAAPIWNKITNFMLEKIPPTAFVRPKGIIEVTIDGRKDLAVSDILPKGLTKVIKNEDKMVFSDSFSSYATSSAQASKDSVTN